MRTGEQAGGAAEGRPTLRKLVCKQLDPEQRTGGLSWLNKVLLVAIALSVAAALLETEPVVSAGREDLFRASEILFTVLFSVEYLARLWVAPENPRCGTGWRARLNWALRPMSLLDLLALLPALFLAGVQPTFMLRLFRLVRILRLARMGRFSTALHLVQEAIWSRRFELWLTLFAAIVVMLVASTLMYLVEGDIQPEQFGSIPRAMWWAVVTLTTIGYGDVYPQTTIGKVLAGCTAVLGIGLIAAPTGILAAAFSDALQRRRELAQAGRAPPADG